MKGDIYVVRLDRGNHRGYILDRYDAIAGHSFAIRLKDRHLSYEIPATALRAFPTNENRTDIIKRLKPAFPGKLRLDYIHPPEMLKIISLDMPEDGLIPNLYRSKVKMKVLLVHRYARSRKLENHIIVGLKQVNQRKSGG
jgi:hypothetical protein